MMLVAARVRPSPIDGMGLFAAEPIAKGMKVWRYAEPLDYRIRGGLCRAGERYTAFIERYGYRPHGADYLEMCGDHAMFWNHSDTPNCGNCEGDGVVALRDIEVGEELTCDYREMSCLPHPFLRE